MSSSAEIDRSASAPGDADRSDRLPRRLGTFTLTLIFVAFSGPLGVLAGYQQLVIAFGNGIGAPLASVAAGVLLILFEIGCIAMSRHMRSPGAFYCYVAEGLGKPSGLAGAMLATAAYLAIAIGAYPYVGLTTVNLMRSSSSTSRCCRGSCGAWSCWRWSPA